MHLFPGQHNIKISNQRPLMKKILTLTAVIYSSFCLADSPFCKTEIHPIDVHLENCLSQEENMTTIGMKECTEQAAKEWDQELNQLYKELMRRLPSESKEKLRTAQRTWVKYKELEVNNISSIYGYSFENVNGGTMLIPMEAEAILEITKARALELNNYLSIL